MEKSAEVAKDEHCMVFKCLFLLRALAWEVEIDQCSSIRRVSGAMILHVYMA